MTETRNIKGGGVITFWNLPRFTGRDRLMREFTQAGWNAFVPEPRTGPAALRSALEEVFPSRDYRVEPLKDKAAFEIINIHRGEDRNDYRHRFWVGIDKGNAVDIKPFDYATADRVVAAFNRHRGLVTTAAVSNALLGVLYSLGGTRLREKGGVYWMAGLSLPRWREAAAAVEAAAQGEKAAVYICHHQIDGDTVRMVRDAITAEVLDESARLKREVLDDDLGERALESRKAEAAGLLDKIALYEGLLSAALPELRRAVEDAEEAASAAALIVASGAAVGV